MGRVLDALKLAAIALVLLAVASRVPFIIAFARDEEKGVPAECKAGPQAIEAALARAPGPVTLGRTRLSECLGRRSDAADVQEIGGSMLAVATRLSPRAQADPEGPPAVRLGYLIGAVRRGSARTQGIFQNLRQRIELEALTVAPRSKAFHRGERAGRASG